MHLQRKKKKRGESAKNSVEESRFKSLAIYASNRLATQKVDGHLDGSPVNRRYGSFTINNNNQSPLFPCGCQVAARIWLGCALGGDAHGPVIGNGTVRSQVKGRKRSPTRRNAIHVPMTNIPRFSGRFTFVDFVLRPKRYVVWERSIQDTRVVRTRASHAHALHPWENTPNRDTKTLAGTHAR